MSQTNATDTDDGERMMAFDCPNCDLRNYLEGKPEDFEKRVFRCLGCPENVLLESHMTRELEISGK